MTAGIKPKVLFVVPLPPPVHGSTVMCQYIKDSKLINDQFDCVFVNLSASRSMAEVHKFQMVKIWRMLKAFLVLIWELITHRYDLCYVALAFHKSLLKDAPFVLLCKLFRRKVVIHLHGKGASVDAQNAIYRWLLKLTFRNCKVVLLSWLLYPDIENFVKKEDVSICPNGIPFAETDYCERKNDIPRLLFLSNLIISKGVFVLLDALKILKHRGYTFICDFVGGGTKEISSSTFEEEVKNRHLEDIVFYHGRKYGDEKDVVFKKSDIFVFPTNEDCFPLVLLEAMSYHLPIVTTNEGAIPDEVIDGENGLIGEQKNPRSVADCIEKLLCDKKMRKEMGKNGYQKLIEHFTIDVYESNIRNILQNYLK